VSGLDSSVIGSDGGYYLPLKFRSFISTNYVEDYSATDSSFRFLSSAGIEEQSHRIAAAYTTYDSFPTDGKFKLGYSYDLNFTPSWFHCDFGCNGAMVDGANNGNSPFLSGFQDITTNSDLQFAFSFDVSADGSYSGTFYPYMYYVPVTVSTDNLVNFPETRTGSLAGDLFYEGDNGTVVAAENATLFDETNNTVNNYQTGTTATASSWTYDYATRTYTITATDGSTYTIRYGDDHAMQTVKDSAGTSTTYNYYYGSGSSDPGTPDDPGGKSGGSIWDKIGDLFGTIADGALTVIKAAVSKILDGLIDLCEMINKKLESVVNSILGLFDQIPKLFSGFTAFLAAVFPFIPVEIQNVLLLAVCLLALIAIINAIRRR
jgi:hypothetical protein